MTRRVVVALLSAILRVFYRRIEVHGIEKVPPAPNPAIFVLNHPNALHDPLFILCRAPRRVSFLAKAPIFRMFFLGFLARALDSLPLYRHQDEGDDPRRNFETFEKARALLSRGGTIAIFPEGTTHDEPSLKPIKSGAARIALSARGGLDSLHVVPVGLYYTEKKTFRSTALVCYGDPLEVAPLADGAQDPPREAVQALSRRIDEALRAVTLNADEVEALEVTRRAERIFSSEREGAGAEAAGTGPTGLARELEMRRRFLDGHAFFAERAPERLAALERRLRRYEDELEAAGGLDPTTLQATYRAGAVVRFALERLVVVPLVLPLALFGALIHWPAYRLADFLAERFAKREDAMLATIKTLAAMLFFPLTWLALFLALWLGLGLRPGGAAAVAFVAGPATGYVAVRFGELLARTIAASRAAFYFVARPRFFAMLLAERRAIRDEILRMADEIDRTRAPARGVAS